MVNSMKPRKPRPSTGRPVGRPTDYRPEYCQAIIDYFENAPKTTERVKSSGRNSESTELLCAEMPTPRKFGKTIGVDWSTLDEWCKKYPEFSSAYNRGKRIQKEWMIDCGILGVIPSATFAFVATNLTDMRNQVDTRVDMTINDSPAEQAWQERKAILAKQRAIDGTTGA